YHPERGRRRFRPERRSRQTDISSRCQSGRRSVAARRAPAGLRQRWRTRRLCFRGSRDPLVADLRWSASNACRHRQNFRAGRTRAQNRSRAVGSGTAGGCLMPKTNTNEQLAHDDLGPSDAPGGQQSATPQYAVGYGRPPIETRFKKGQSGNPKGRAKGRRNVKSEIEEIAYKTVNVKDGD